MLKELNNLLSKINKKIFVDNKRNTSIVGMITIIIIISVIFSFEASAIETLDAADELAKLKNKIGSTGPLDEMEQKSGTETFSGTNAQNSETAEEFNIDEPAVIRVRATLTWTDTGPSLGLGLTQTNQPDEFGITITAPSGEIDSSGLVSNNAGTGDGVATAEIDLDPLVPPEGNFEFTVEAGDCGDVTGGVFGIIRTAEDNDNSWSLTIEYFYYEMAE